MSAPMSYLLRLLLRGYQVLVSPLVGPACRFEPTCSAYAIEAIEHHGPARGSVLAALRLARCHPFGGSGFDPVPPPRADGAAGAVVDGAHNPAWNEP